MTKNRALIIAIIMALFVSCNRNSNKIYETDKNKIAKNNKIIKGISSEELRKILINFIVEIDSFYNISLCYSLSFYKNKYDTMLAIESNIFFPEITKEKKSYYELKGISFVYGNKIAIYDYKKSLGGLYYDYDKLEIYENLNKIDSLNKLYSNLNEGFLFVFPYKLYKINGSYLLETYSYIKK